MLPDWPDGLGDAYVCTAFPDDDRPLDSFIVALIALAVGLPVTLFLQAAFEIANDAEQPESWLVWRGAARLLLGLRAHRRWHYTGPDGQPRRFVRWYIRSKDAPMPEVAAAALHALRCALTGATPRWTLQARASAAKAAEAAEADADERGACAREPDAEDGLDSHVPGFKPLPADGAADAREAASLSLYKRACAAAGLVGTVLTWAAFAWFILTYGALVTELLGEGAQSSFARSWGVSYGVGAAADWRDVVKEAAQAVALMVLLEWLCLTRNTSWLEVRRLLRPGGLACAHRRDVTRPRRRSPAQEHVDYLSLQALLFRDGVRAPGWTAQIRLFFRHTKRLGD